MTHLCTWLLLFSVLNRRWKYGGNDWKRNVQSIRTECNEKERERDEINFTVACLPFFKSLFGRALRNRWWWWLLLLSSRSCSMAERSQAKNLNSLSFFYFTCLFVTFYMSFALFMLLIIFMQHTQNRIALQFNVQMNED